MRRWSVLLALLVGCEVITEAEVREPVVSAPLTRCTYEERLGCSVQEFLSDGEFVVPEGVGAVVFQLWGGGGGAGENNAVPPGGFTDGIDAAPSSGGDGGAGAYIYAEVTVQPGERYVINVGQAGKRVGGAGCYGGADGGELLYTINPSKAGQGGGGGGATCVTLAGGVGPPLLIAAGGGGGGGGAYSERFFVESAHGGNGGAPIFGEIASSFTSEEVHGGGHMGQSNRVSPTSTCNEILYRAGEGGGAGIDGGAGGRAGSTETNGAHPASGKDARISLLRTFSTSGGDGGGISYSSVLSGGGGGGGGGGFTGGGGGGAGGACLDQLSRKAQIAGGSGGGLGQSYPDEPTVWNTVDCAMDHCGFGARSSGRAAEAGMVAVSYLQPE